MTMIFSSSTSRSAIDASARFEPVRDARAGDVVLVEVLTVNPAYPNLERADGSFVRIEVGDRIVGALGSRQALRGYVGHAPVALEAGETLALLNMGGVVGRFVDSTTSLGEPVRVRYLGTVVDEAGVVNLDRTTLPAAAALDGERPIVLAVGTCMHVGKTTTIAKLIEAATAAGHRVGAAKIAGVAAIRDLGEFAAAGAVDVKSFLDCGIASTVDADDLAPVFKSVVNALDGDVVLVEMGDGIVGHYRVETVLEDAEIMSRVSAVVVCAGDLMSAYGAKLYLDNLGVPISAFSGLVTENVSGSDYIESWLGVPAVNGLKEPQRLLETLAGAGGWGSGVGAARTAGRYAESLSEREDHGSRA
jgi:hypothetical protein